MGRPTYRDLQRRIQDLEKGAQEQYWIEEAYSAFVDNSLQGLHLLQGEKPRVVFANSVYAGMLGYTVEEITSLSPEEVINLVHPDDQAEVWKNYLNRLRGIPTPQRYEFRIVKRDRTLRWAEAFATLMRYKGNPTSQVVLVDITERKLAQERLQEAHNELERRVQERTSELLRANQQLKAREKELQSKTINLKESNTALRVLLKTKEEDEKEIEERILFNIKGTVEPYLEKLRASRLDKEQKTVLTIIESNLSDIASPLSARLSSGYYDLSQAEVQVANLVVQGKTTKEIANLLNLSPRTIETQRNSIRKKLGLRNRKKGLRTHLLSIQ